MSVVFHYIKEKFFMPSSREVDSQFSLPVDSDPLDANVGGVDVGQRVRVLSSSHPTRDPSSFFARAVLWEATSWMHPRTEELRRDKGPLGNLLKPLGIVGRSVARLIYTLVVPTLAGAAGILYHPAKGFYQLCRAGLYAIKSRNGDKEMKKIATEALRLTGQHARAVLGDFTLMLFHCSILGAVVSVFKHLESDHMKTILYFAFGEEEYFSRFRARDEIKLRSTKLWFLKD